MNETAKALLGKIESRDAVVGVIGLGYVGLPLAHALHQGGLRVVGFDVDPAKPRAIQEGRAYLKHLGGDMVRTLGASGRFSATTNFAELAHVDVAVICVPTPIGAHQEPDLSYVIASGEAVGAAVHKGMLIVLESTTYPGTTRRELLDTINRTGATEKGLRVNDDFFLAFSPEREDPGRKDHSTQTIPKLVGGLNNVSTKLAAALYRAGIASVVEVSSAEVAEAAKLLENIFRAVNIAMVNEMKVVLEGMGVDVWEVVEAASTKPFGFMPFYPGPGLGGHCIPIDPFYLAWKAKEVGATTRFIELAGEINTAMPAYVVERLAGALNGQGKPINGSRILVLGLAYKPDVDDTRESPSFELIARLRDAGACVEYADPHVPVAPQVRKHDLGMESVDVTQDTVSRFDALVIATNHSDFDYALVAKHAKLVVDTRGALRPWASDMGERLVRA